MIEESGTCKCSGDPHCLSFDGKWLHFQGDCQYVMATDGCNGSVSTFAVYAQYWDRNVPSAVVRYVKNVTLVLNGTTVSTNISFSRLTMSRL